MVENTIVNLNRKTLCSTINDQCRVTSSNFCVEQDQLIGCVVFHIIVTEIIRLTNW